MPPKRPASPVDPDGIPAKKTAKAKKIPTTTLYVHNLDDTIGIAALRTELYMMFSTYGHVVALNAHKSPKMRGQAHIVFSSAAAAENARESLQNTQFLGKPLHIEWARKPSHRASWLGLA